MRQTYNALRAPLDISGRSAIALTVFLFLGFQAALTYAGQALTYAFGVTYVHGPNRTRTCDLVVISDALYQLSYEPD